MDKAIALANRFISGVVKEVQRPAEQQDSMPQPNNVPTQIPEAVAA
jgi:hypothetical protein